MSRIPLEAAPAESRTATNGALSFAGILLRIAGALVLLLPCFWQRHMETLDLPSHLYEAWVAGQIELGKAVGLRLVSVRTNVLSDRVLEWLIYRVGTVWAERAVAGVAVLLFFSGAFRLIQAVSGRRPWLLAPCLAMLTWGLLFHLGFLNDYLSTGFCLWIVALGWNPASRQWLKIAPLAVLAAFAHPAPLAWAAGVLAYIGVWRRIPSARRFLLPLGALVALVAANLTLNRLFPTRWLPGELLSLAGVMGVTGAEQVWIFGPKYVIVAGGLLVIWCALFAERLERGKFPADPVAQLWLLHAAAFALLPSAIQFPQYQHVLAYIPQRISLFTAIVFCAMVAGSRYGRNVVLASAVVCGIFFTFLYRDDAALNRAEDQITALVAALPPGQRVVSAVTDADARVNALTHVADRACIGRCISYGNYEAATGQFRIRVASPHPQVAPDMGVVKEIEEGRHVVKEWEAPMYSVCPGAGGGARFQLRELHTGETTCAFAIPVTPRF